MLILSHGNGLKVANIYQLCSEREANFRIFLCFSLCLVIILTFCHPVVS